MIPFSPVFHTVVTVSNWTQNRTQSENISSTISGQFPEKNRRKLFIGTQFENL